ncbi:hypothetical protein CRENPOLYSF1_1230027 [Crenothrix polyspora]|uniref:Uncharacterized protein n=1 Tax=Crenothrix polyspora TaxID=360316 RepID=A0A1R4H0V3_9GAMM|nr:hypothetical protein CRENPOLYSF1_1230027 [Crenothrix polyspora]
MDYIDSLVRVALFQSLLSTLKGRFNPDWRELTYCNNILYSML